MCCVVVEVLAVRGRSSSVFADEVKKIMVQIEQQAQRLLGQT